MGKKMYIGVDGKARKVKKVYVGVDGETRCIFSDGELTNYGIIQACNNYAGMDMTSGAKSWLSALFNKR